MKFLFLTKRHYTNRDLLHDRFGRLYHLPVGLAHRGIEGTVYALDYRTRASDVLDAGGVRFVSLPYYRVNLPWILASILEDARRDPPDVVVASGDINFGLYGLFLARRLGVPFVFDVYDNYLSYGNNRYPGAEALLAHVIRSSDAITTVSHKLVDYVSALNARVTLIDNGVCTDTFAPRDRDDARRRLGLDAASLYVGYFGSIEERSGTDVLVRAVSRLRAETGRDVRLLLAGRNASTLDLGQPFVEYRGLVPQTQVADMIAASDVVSIPYIRHALNDYCGACKLAEYLAAERPMAATDVGEARRFLEPFEVPLAEPGSDTSLARVLRAQLDSPVLAAMPRDLTWDALADRFHVTVRSAIERRAA